MNTANYEPGESLQILVLFSTNGTRAFFECDFEQGEFVKQPGRQILPTISLGEITIVEEDLSDHTEGKWSFEGVVRDHGQGLRPEALEAVIKGFISRTEIEFTKVYKRTQTCSQDLQYRFENNHGSWVGGYRCVETWPKSGESDTSHGPAMCLIGHLRPKWDERP